MATTFIKSFLAKNRARPPAAEAGRALQADVLATQPADASARALPSGLAAVRMPMNPGRRVHVFRSTRKKINLTERSQGISTVARFAGGGERSVPEEAQVRELVERAVAHLVAATLDARVDALVEQKVAQIVGTLAPPQNAALQAARERGAAYARQQYARHDNLTLQDAARLTGRSDKLINQRRNEGRLYALVLDGNSRGFRYPAWQFDAQDERLAAVLAELANAKVSCWLVHDFMERPNEVLGGQRPCDWIVDPARPVEAAVLAARRRFAGDQGAG